MRTASSHICITLAYTDTPLSNVKKLVKDPLVEKFCIKQLKQTSHGRRAAKTILEPGNTHQITDTLKVLSGILSTNTLPDCNLIYRATSSKYTCRNSATCASVSASTAFICPRVIFSKAFTIAAPMLFSSRVCSDGWLSNICPSSVLPERAKPNRKTGSSAAFPLLLTGAWLASPALKLRWRFSIASINLSCSLYVPLAD